MNFKNAASALFLTATGIVNLISALPASAKPVDGVFSIQSRNGNYVDVYGDNFRNPGDNTRVATHLWNLKDKSNNFELGPDEMSGNEIRVAGNPGGQPICITPNAPLGSRPADGTAVVATRDCNNSWNWKRVGQQWVIGRHMDLCLDIVWGKDRVLNGMQVVTCGNNNPAQQFGTGQAKLKVQPTAVNIPPVVNQRPVQQPISRPVVIQGTRVPAVYPVRDGVTEDVNVKYTAVLISARAGSFQQSPVKVGHTIFAAVKRWDRKYYTIYSNGTKIETYSEPKEETTTVSSPGPEVKLDFNAVRVDLTGLDKNLLDVWKTAGNSPRVNGYSFRTLSIDEEHYRRSVTKAKGGYNTSYRGLACANYALFAKTGCNCTTVSTKMFLIATGEDFTDWNPTGLAQSIDKSNWLGDWNTFRLPISF
jgi:hypothetical protein